MDRVASLESRVANLADRVAMLEQRLAYIEERAPGSLAATDGLTTTQGPDPPLIVDFERIRLQQLLALSGRTLVVLGGAYLLRALTESQWLSASAGVSLGILYSAPWLMFAARAAARGNQLDAFVHALTVALIGYPLVWEATLRFNVVSPSQGAALLGVLTAVAFLLSWLRALEGLAWVVTLGTLISAAGLAIGTGNWTAYTALAIAVGIATLWLGYTRDWTVLRWPAAAIANLMLLILTGRAAADGQVSEALLVQMLMLAGYLGSFAVRTLLIGRPVIPFEVAQSLGVLAVAYGGAIALIRSTGSNVVLVGVASISLATFAYTVAFSFVDRHRHRKNFFFYAVLAQLFAIVGVVLCTGENLGSVIYSLAAVVAAALAWHTGRLVLSLQAAVYAVAGTLASGLAAGAALALLSPAIDWVSISPTQGLALFAIAFVTVLRVRHPVESWGMLTSILHLAVIIVLVWAAAGTAVMLAMAALPGGDHIGGSSLATIRTAAFVLATFALSLAAGLPSGREAGWLVFPMLFLTGAKVVGIDFPQGRPETLFIALALYGVALIAAPRLLRRPTRAMKTATVVKPIAHDNAATRNSAVVAGNVRK